jgi:hypothetical protein
MPALRSVTDVARHFADYLNRVAFHGERFLLIRGKHAVAELRPVPPNVRVGDLATIFAAWPHLGETEAAAFAADLAQAAQR